jgi:radical SAM-linked protein
VKVRIKFQKYGVMKFIGHLDVMRYFQKAFRRANFDNEYSKGYSPHQIMSFAAPLGVGLTSDGEYLDVQLLSSDTPQVMMDRLNAVITEGFRITGFHPLLDREDNKREVTAMSLVTAADYMVSLKDGYTVGNLNTHEKFQKAFETFITSPEIVIGKKTKTSEKAVDIKPMITFSAFSLQEYEDKLNPISKVEEGLPDFTRVKQEYPSVADIYENGIKLYLQVATGSAANLKPELVMEAFCESLEIPFEKFAWQVHRIEVYSKDEAGTLIPLDQLER